MYFSDKISEYMWRQSNAAQTRNRVQYTQSVLLSQEQIDMAHISNTHITKGEGNVVHQGLKNKYDLK